MQNPRNHCRNRKSCSHHHHHPHPHNHPNHEAQQDNSTEERSFANLAGSFKCSFIMNVYSMSGFPVAT